MHGHSIGAGGRVGPPPRARVRATRDEDDNIPKYDPMRLTQDDPIDQYFTHWHRVSVTEYGFKLDPFGGAERIFDAQTKRWLVRDVVGRSLEDEWERVQKPNGSFERFLRRPTRKKYLEDPMAERRQGKWEEDFDDGVDLRKHANYEYDYTMSADWYTKTLVNSSNPGSGTVLYDHPWVPDDAEIARRAEEDARVYARSSAVRRPDEVYMRALDEGSTYYQALAVEEVMLNRLLNGTSQTARLPRSGREEMLWHHDPDSAHADDANAQVRWVFLGASIRRGDKYFYGEWQTKSRNAVQGGAVQDKLGFVQECTIICIDLGLNAPIPGIRPRYMQPERRKIVAQKMLSGGASLATRTDAESKALYENRGALDAVSNRQQLKSSGKRNAIAKAKKKVAERQRRAKARNDPMSAEAYAEALDEAIKAAERESAAAFEESGGGLDLYPERLKDIANPRRSYQKRLGGEENALSVKFPGTTLFATDADEQNEKSSTPDVARKWPLLREGDIRPIEQPAPGEAGGSNATGLSMEQLCNDVTCVWFATCGKYVYNERDATYLPDTTTAATFDVASRQGRVPADTKFDYKVPYIWKASHMYNAAGYDATGPGEQEAESLKRAKTSKKYSTGIAPKAAGGEIRQLYNTYRDAMAAYDLAYTQWRAEADAWRKREDLRERYIRWYLTMGEPAKNQAAIDDRERSMVSLKDAPRPDSFVTRLEVIEAEAVYWPLKRLRPDRGDKVVSYLTEAELNRLFYPFDAAGHYEVLFPWRRNRARVDDDDDDDDFMDAVPGDPDSAWVYMLAPPQRLEPVGPPPKPRPPVIRGGQETAMNVGVGRSGTHEIWRDIPMDIFEDATFTFMWNKMVPPLIGNPPVASSNFGMPIGAATGTPPHIHACKDATNKLSEHKGAFVLGYALYDRAEWEAFLEANPELNKKDILDSEKESRIAKLTARAAKAKVKKERRDEKERKKQQVRDRRAEEEGRNEEAAMERESLREWFRELKDAQKEWSVKALYPVLVLDGQELSLRDLSNVDWWNKYIAKTVNIMPYPDPGDLGGLGPEEKRTLNGQNGIRYESKRSYEERMREWSNESSEFHKLPWTPVRHEASFKKYAVLCNLPPEYAKLGLAGDRGGRKYSEHFSSKEVNTSPYGGPISYEERRDYWQRRKSEVTGSQSATRRDNGGPSNARDRDNKDDDAPEEMVKRVEQAEALSDEEPSDEAPSAQAPSDEEPSDEERKAEAQLDRLVLSLLASDEEPSDEEPSDEELSDEELSDEERIAQAEERKARAEAFVRRMLMEDEAPSEQAPSEQAPSEQAPSEPMDVSSPLDPSLHAALQRVHNLLIGDGSLGQPGSYAALGRALRARSEQQLFAVGSKLLPEEAQAMMKCWENAAARVD